MGRRDSLVEIIGQNIERDIIIGSLKPGDSIREIKYAKKNKCSQTPVREALRFLEQYNLFGYEISKGTKVIPIIIREERKNIYELAQHIEEKAVELARQQIIIKDRPETTSEQKEKLEHLKKNMEEKFKVFENAEKAMKEKVRTLSFLAELKDDPLLYDYVRSHCMFHEAVWKLSGSICWENVMTRLMRPMWVFLWHFYVSNPDLADLQQEVKEWFLNYLQGPEKHHVILDYTLEGRGTPKDCVSNYMKDPLEVIERLAIEKKFEKNYSSFLVGKKASRKISGSNGEVIIEEGDVITEEVINRASEEEKFLELLK